MESELDPESDGGGNITTTLHLLFILTLIITVHYFMSKFSKRDKKKRQDPHKKGTVSNPHGLEVIPTVRPRLPLIGNVHLLLPFSKSLQNVENLLKTYSDISKFVGFNQTFIVLHSAPLVQSMLKSGDFGHVSKVPYAYDIMKPYIINGVLVSNGAFWQKQRKILMKSQSFPSLKGYMGMLNKHCGRLVSELEQIFQDGQPHQIMHEVSIVFLRIIVEMITGDISGLTSEEEFIEYHKNFEIWRKTVGIRGANPFLHINALWKLHPMCWKYEKAVKYLSDFARMKLVANREKRAKLAAESKAHPEVNVPNEEGNEEGGKNWRCVIDELIDAGVDDDQIVDEVNTMMAAGHETVATGIHFFCFAIGLHPSIQQECRQEVDQMFERNPDKVTFDSLQTDLKYVDRCIQETLRLFSPGLALYRKLATPLDLEHKGEVIRLPVGTSIAMSPYLIHRKEEYYPDPDKFDPDRFLPEEQAKRHPYAYLPFSAGPRSCLGMKFSMLEMKIVAAYLLRNFEWETMDKRHEIGLVPYITLTPVKDYTFMFKKRCTTCHK